jgi:hypothetical protein
LHLPSFLTTLTLQPHTRTICHQCVLSLSMKLFSLDHDGRCMVIKLNGIRILLDCPLDLTKLVHFQPPLRGPTASTATPSPTTSTSSSSNMFLGSVGELVTIASVPRFATPNFSMLEPQTIDVVVISNWDGILALPFLLSDPTFTPAIYATEPTIQLGRYALTCCLSMIFIPIQWLVGWLVRSLVGWLVGWLILPTNMVTDKL